MSLVCTLEYLSTFQGGAAPPLKVYVLVNFVQGASFNLQGDTFNWSPHVFSMSKIL